MELIYIIIALIYSMLGVLILIFGFALCSTMIQNYREAQLIRRQIILDNVPSITIADPIDPADDMV